MPKKTFSDTLGIDSLQLTEKQKLAQDVIDRHTLTFVSGPAGTGKTLAVLSYYVRWYLKDKTKKICIIRTPVEAGPDRLGFTPGSETDKALVHFKSSEHSLKNLLSTNKFDCDFGKRIKFWVPNYILGSTWDDCLILVDEAQQLHPLVMKMILERIGKNSKCVVCGDPTQLYVTDKNRNGLNDAIGRFFTEYRQPLYDDVGYVQFDVEDVQRSSIVKTVIKAYSE